jgi:hypothetical protein
LTKVKSQLTKYVLFAHQNTDIPSSTGIAEIGGNDAMITLGVSVGQVGTIDDHAGTLMHELGHTFNLRHGGPDDGNTSTDDLDNCKPNYLSVMNYAYQTTEYVSDRPIDFSRYVESHLNEENGIDETAGFNPLDSRWNSIAYGTPSRIPIVSSDGSNIDWNGDGDDTQTSVIDANVNHFNGVTKCMEDAYTGEPVRKDLVGSDDWNNLVFDFKSSVLFQDGIHQATASIGELTIDTIREMRLSVLQGLLFEIQSLPDSSFASPASNSRLALENEISSIDNLILSDDLEGILQSLQNLRAQMDGSDGGSTSDDLIIDASSQQRILLILDRMISVYDKNLIPASVHDKSHIETINSVISEINKMVSDGTLEKGEGNSLTVKLNVSLNKMNGEKKTPCENLHAFTNEINALVQSGRLSASDVQPIIEQIQSVADDLCPE